MRPFVYWTLSLLVFFIMVVALAGCGKYDEAVYQPAQIAQPTPLSKRIPDSMFRCEPEPSGEGVETNLDAAEYIEDLKDAGRDCRRKLTAAGKVVKNDSPVSAAR